MPTPMFSQFRQAVEGFAPQPRRSTDSPADENYAASRSNSADLGRPLSPLSSSQLAESIPGSLRKSLATQRSDSPSSSAKTSGLTSPRQKATLEDRLRAATFAIADSSNASSQQASTRDSPSPMNAMTASERPLSPPSIILPDSPEPNSVESVLNSTSPEKPPTDASAHGTTEREPSSVLEASDANGNSQSDVPSDSSNAEMSVGRQSGSLVEELQKRLQELERRFADVSLSFKRLQAEKDAANTVLRDFTPLNSIEDSSALSDYLQSMSSKVEALQGDVGRLTREVKTQAERFDELREVHKLEAASQTVQLDRLRTQLDEAEALLRAAQAADDSAAQNTSIREAEITQLHTEIETLKRTTKEEEEKRVKAISLLKTVRQKLVKAEKEREEAVKEAVSLMERVEAEKEKEAKEKTRLRQELIALNTEKDKAIAALKVQHGSELDAAKARHEKDLMGVRKHLEQEEAMSKNAYLQELSLKAALITSLESSLSSVKKDKEELFDSLQLRQAEWESAQSHLESLQSQNTELEFQLRKADERYTLVQDDFAEMQHELDLRSREPVSSLNEVAQLLAATAAKYESRATEMKKQLTLLERDRNEIETQWSNKMRLKTEEVESLKKQLEDANQAQKHEGELAVGLKNDIQRLQAEVHLLQDQLSQSRSVKSPVSEVESPKPTPDSELLARITILEQQLEESKSRESQLRAGNKTLREELRKVQSSAALLERQRNPGVGYWTNRTADGPSESRTSVSSVSSNSPSRTGSPAPGVGLSEEDVNYEYLRNVILQFLEHKEMRPNLVKVLSVILRFTPQETRRLIAKV